MGTLDVPALQGLAEKHLAEQKRVEALGDHLQSVVTFVKHAHMSVARKSETFLANLGRHNYVTPTSYLELLSTYNQVLGLKRDEVGTLKNRLQVGLDKLISTATQVEALQVRLHPGTAAKPLHWLPGRLRALRACCCARCYCSSSPHSP